MRDTAHARAVIGRCGEGGPAGSYLRTPLRLWRWISGTLMSSTVVNACGLTSAMMASASFTRRRGKTMRVTRTSPSRPSALSTVSGKPAWRSGAPPPAAPPLPGRRT
jgi:hypothetical protein